jgi:RNA polymerase sigma-70 factor (ECF subfamily)
MKGHAMTEADASLFRRACQGDHDAFWRLVLPHRGLVYSVAIGMLRNHERAEDELHDVLLAAFHSLSNLRDPAKLPSWLYSLTRNHVLDSIRREQRLRKAARTGAGQARVVSVAEMADRLEREDWFCRMEEAMAALPEPFRVILGMKYTNDYSCGELAEILGLSVPAVKSRLFEARKLLRKRIEALAATEKERSHEVS